MIRTVEVDGDTTVTAWGDLSHLCPYRDETDNGRVRVVWQTEGQTIELHSLADYFASYADSRMSHEEITDRIRHDLSTILGLTLLMVTTEWDTAGLEVVCATSPTLHTVG